MGRRIAAIAVAGFGLIVLAGAACAQQHNAAWLLGLLRDQASLHAAQAQALHHDRDAANWRAWATLYGGLAGDPRLRALDAAAFARNNAKFNEEEAQVMSRNGIGPGADLYAGSAQMWADLARQLASGLSGPVVHFPEKQMLSPIGGLAGTPWQDLGGHHASDCRTLAQRAAMCRAQLTQLRHHDLLTGQSSDFLQVSMTRSCDAAQELYVAQCQQ